MPTTFNADEVFEIAEQIERNGAKFYRQAAENTADEDAGRMLLDLAVMEDGHLKTFQQIRQQLSDREKEQTVFDPDNQAALYLQAIADAHGWEGRISPMQELTGSESIGRILEIALNAEKESVVYYSGLRNSVSEKAGRDKVDAIINEELGHIKTLLDRLKKVREAQ